MRSTHFLLLLSITTTLILPSTAESCNTSCQLQNHCPNILTKCKNNKNCQKSLDCFENCPDCPERRLKNCFMEACDNENYLALQFCLSHIFEQYETPTQHLMRPCGDCSKETVELSQSTDASFTLHCIDECFTSRLASKNYEEKFRCSASCISKFKTHKEFKNMAWCQAGCKITKVLSRVNTVEDMFELLMNIDYANVNTEL